MPTYRVFANGAYAGEVFATDKSEAKQKAVGQLRVHPESDVAVVERNEKPTFVVVAHSRITKEDLL